MSSLTKKLFEKLSDKPENIEVNAELLSYFKEFEDLDEYRSVVGSLDNPVSRTENLKKLVFRLYGDHKLKDLDFFKYLVWSGQENLCKLIGYGHKQIEKMMKDKPPQAMDDQRPHLIRGNDTDDKMETDTPINQNDATAHDMIKSDDHEMFTDRPIRQNEPAATTTPDTISPTEPGPTYIIYSKENSDAVLEVSGFLRNCGLACDIDQYHTHENITQWGVWIENKIKEVAKNKGFVLLICSSKMYQQLSDPNSSRIEMKAGHIVTPTLNNLITDPATTNCIIPVCLEEVNKEIVPISLHGRTIYSLSFSALMKVNPNADLRSILDRPELESLRSLVYRLRGELEINRPPIRGPKH